MLLNITDCMYVSVCIYIYIYIYCIYIHTYVTMLLNIRAYHISISILEVSSFIPPFGDHARILPLCSSPLLDPCSLQNRLDLPLR